MATPKKETKRVEPEAEQDENITKLEEAIGSIDDRAANAKSLRLIAEVLLAERKPPTVEPGD